jgi:hypothetical protein
LGATFDFPPLRIKLILCYYSALSKDFTSKNTSGNVEILLVDLKYGMYLLKTECDGIVKTNDLFDDVLGVDTHVGHPLIVDLHPLFQLT